MRALALLVACSAVVLCGCPPASRPPSVFPTADDALGRMHAQYACVNGVRGTAKIDHRNPQGKIRGDLYLFAVNPDRVRFDVISPFGAVIFSLTSDGKSFEMTDNKEKQFLTGPAKACNLARLTQVPVPGYALVSLLRGEAPVLVHKPEESTIAWDEKGFYRLLLPSTRGAKEEIHLEVHPDDAQKPWAQQRVRVRDVLVNQAGVDLYHVELDRFEAAHTDKPREGDADLGEPAIPPSGPACDAELPQTIRMRVPATEEDVIFSYKEGFWNPPLIKGLFTQTAPSGSHASTVDCKD
jgi:outer membrane lipoprotein-sorting protein